jgi:hypothetical protein
MAFQEARERVNTRPALDRQRFDSLPVVVRDKKFIHSEANAVGRDRSDAVPTLPHGRRSSLQAFLLVRLDLELHTV